MHTHQCRFLREDLPLHQGQVQIIVDSILKGHQVELAKLCGKAALGDPFHGLFMLDAEPDQIGDGADLEILLSG